MTNLSSAFVALFEADSESGEQLIGMSTGRDRPTATGWSVPTPPSNSIGLLLASVLDARDPKLQTKSLRFFIVCLRSKRSEV